VSRSKKTGVSKGYAFLQFKHAEVAAIAAEAMNGYMMFGQMLKCHTIKREDVHTEMFKHANRKMRKRPWLKIAAERHNRDRSSGEEKRREEALIRKDQRRQKRIKELGIDYDYDALKPRKQNMKIKY
jgi:nucleolar protein 15